jgi:hypothetical protein
MTDTYSAIIAVYFNRSRPTSIAVGIVLVISAPSMMRIMVRQTVILHVQ